MSERGETDSRSIGCSDKFRATAVRRNVVNHQTRLWQRFQRTGDVTRQPVSGRPRVTTPCQDRYLVISARRQRAVLPEHWVQHSQSPQEYEFRDKLFTGDSIMLACIPEDQQFAFPSRLRINTLV
ncbi:paired domain-containing protein [Trichonephila clavipes]|uniref:Paired domain-containing protein n=1 Tax=Trichonephila clavipes TaxID=2585209 RepID=A0A8X6SD15_TRICX|nr:paired domain-containing protein [Trichonephila clavipes]